MSFAVRAATNSLATPDNLARWRKVVDPKCPQIGCTQTGALGHLLSNCEKMLNRYTHRHDSVLALIYENIRKNNPASVELYCDIEGLKVNGGTMPPEIALTSKKPDLVIVDRRSNPVTITLLELTVPWDSTTNFDSAYNRKRTRYEYLANDIESKGYKCNNLPWEIGCRGVVNGRNRSLFFTLCNIFNIRNGKSLLKSIGKVALLGSYQIWRARNSDQWTPGGLLKP